MITTTRLRLEHLTLADAEDFHTVWGDPEVIFWGASPDLESSRALLREFTSRRIENLSTSGWFAVRRREDDAFVGDVVLEPASWDPRAAEVGWHMARAHHGQGYATEAARALVHAAFVDGVLAVWAKILPDNEPSRRVAAKLGMHQSGTVEHHGQEHDLWFIRRD